MATGFRLECLRRSWHCFAFDQQKPHAMIGGRVAGGGVRGGRCPWQRTSPGVFPQVLKVQRLILLAPREKA